MSFYAIRYLPEVPMDRRKHSATLGRFPTWLDAEDQRLAQPNKDDLQVEERQEADR